MLNMIRKIFFVVILLRVTTMIAEVIHGPLKVVGIVALLFCGTRMVFTKEHDGSEE